MVAVLFVTACSDSPTEQHTPTSGLYHALIPTLGDSLNVVLSFSFDEVTPSTADGGVRLQVINNSRHPEIRPILKSGHTLSKLRRIDDDVVEIAGSAHLGGAFGTVEFSGEMTDDSVFSFRFKSAAGSGSAVAHYDGPYVKATTPSLPGVRANLNGMPGNVGSFDINGTSNSSALLNPSLGDPDLPPSTSVSSTIVITGTTPDGYGGLAVTGYLNGIVQYVQQQAAANSRSDIWGSLAYFEFGTQSGCTSNSGLLQVQTQQWNPNTATSGTFTVETPLDGDEAGCDASPTQYSGNVSISAGR